jgi:uncharacterized coiled-coil DUF342 family protein
MTGDTLEEKPGSNSSENKTQEVSAAAPQAVAQPKEEKVPPRKSLEELIAESKNEEAISIKKEIDRLKKERGAMVAKIRDSKHRLDYKEKEYEMVAKKVAGSKTNKEDDLRKVRKLRHIKERLEFRVSTEATSLAAEKDLVRRINEVDQEIKEALKSVKMERKLGLVKGDIDFYRTSVVDLSKEIGEADGKLDELYAKVKSMLGIHRKRPFDEARRKTQQQQQQEINLEDIAVITRK